MAATMFEKDTMELAESIAELLNGSRENNPYLVKRGFYCKQVTIFRDEPYQSIDLIGKTWEDAYHCALAVWQALNLDR